MRYQRPIKDGKFLEMPERVSPNDSYSNHVHLPWRYHRLEILPPTKTEMDVDPRKSTNCLKPSTCRFISFFLGSGTLLTRKFQGPFDLFFIVEQHVGRLRSFEAFFSTLTDGNERQFLPATMTPLSVIRCTRVREFLSGILLPFNDREKQYIFYKFLMAS